MADLQGGTTSSTPSGQNREVGWPDALIGLSQFIAATKRQKHPPPSVPSFAGIGSPAPAGPLVGGPKMGKVNAPGTLGQYL